MLKKSLPGVIVGAIASGFLSGHVLTAIFAAMALMVALNMAFKRDGFAVADGMSGHVGTALLGGGIMGCPRSWALAVEPSACPF